MLRKHVLKVPATKRRTIMQVGIDISRKRAANQGSSSDKKPRLITDFFKQSKRSSSASNEDNKVKNTRQSTPEGSRTVRNELGEPKAEQPKVGGNQCNVRRISSIPYENDYSDFCSKINFDKNKWVESLSEEEKDLLGLEINTLHITWLAFLSKTIRKPYFLNLKKFLNSQTNKTVFPPRHLIYSWSHYTPLPSVKCIILGQDPYHNYNQAHGLAFSVLEPTRPPPSLLNIYKGLAIDFPNFIAPNEVLSPQGKSGGGNLSKWALRGVLMLNAVLTVECHQANSHAQKGWETFTEEVIRTAINYHREKTSGFVIMAWGTPAQNRVKSFTPLLSKKFLVLKTVHPSPLSANRGFFELQVFKRCNEWLGKNGRQRIDWGLIENNIVM